MKLNKINIELVFRTAAYESVRLGGEYTLTKGESMESAALQADKEIRDAFAALMQQRKDEEKAPAGAPEGPASEQQAPTQENAADGTADTPTDKKRQRVTPNDKDLLQKIANRVAAGVTLEKVHEYYEFDENAEHVLQIAAQMSKIADKQKNGEGEK